MKIIIVDLKRSPLGNRLYDPSFAAKGLPVDPHLRMLKQNPNYCKSFFLFLIFKIMSQKWNNFMRILIIIDFLIVPVKIERKPEADSKGEKVIDLNE